MSNDHDARREAVAVSAGALTGAGGRASHAVVVALERGKVCLVGCEGLEFDLTARTARSGGQLPSDGKVVCLDTESGLVFAGAPAITEERSTEALNENTGWHANLASADKQG